MRTGVSFPAPLLSEHWSSPLEQRPYDRSVDLGDGEQAVLRDLAESHGRWGDGGTEGARIIQRRLARLITPLREAMALMEGRALRPGHGSRRVDARLSPRAAHVLGLGPHQVDWSAGR